MRNIMDSAALFDVQQRSKGRQNWKKKRPLINRKAKFFDAKKIANPPWFYLNFLDRRRNSSTLLSQSFLIQKKIWRPSGMKTSPSGGKQKPWNDSFCRCSFTLTLKVLELNKHNDFYYNLYTKLSAHIQFQFDFISLFPNCLFAKTTTTSTRRFHPFLNNIGVVN